MAVDAAAGSTIHCCIGETSDDAGENGEDDLDDFDHYEISRFALQHVKEAEPEQEPALSNELSLAIPFSALGAGSDEEGTFGLAGGPHTHFDPLSSNCVEHTNGEAEFEKEAVVVEADFGKAAVRPLARGIFESDDRDTPAQMVQQRQLIDEANTQCAAY